MQPRISVVTLAVNDLEKAVAFYRDGLGLPTQGIIGKEFEYGAVAFFDLQNGLKLALWPRTSLAHDTQLKPNEPAVTDFTLGHNVASKAEVDAVMEQAKSAGATIVKSAQNTFYGGYAGYFQDLDQHLWEIVYNPAFDLND
ncbi:VOC family protein [Adhaeribacter radiodurans]|uniref:VOC family protein n=1 Tax=Adhaeribacter radiodurans TaxID=2745197 RepID=A0A7L7L2A9_9BACT|nr:VOC family protein [Adhaeribacter radiodurans]QMU26589.1 VOC family protein [Adhaeribacter radiodurans]